MFNQAKTCGLFCPGRFGLDHSRAFLFPTPDELLTISMNRGFGLFIIWITTIIGVQYKHVQETQAYLAAIVESPTMRLSAKPSTARLQLEHRRRTDLRLHGRRGDWRIRQVFASGNAGPGNPGIIAAAEMGQTDQLL